MAFTTTDVVERAAGHLSIRTEGRALSAFEGGVLLSYLNDIFAQVNAFQGGVDYHDREVLSDLTLRNQERALVITGQSVTLRLPNHPRDGMKVNIVDVGSRFEANPVTVDRNDRLINGEAKSSLLDVDGANVVYTYREDSSSWVMQNTVMDLGREVPLPQDFMGHLGAWVAIEAWEEFRGGQEPSFRLQERADRGERLIRARFSPNSRARLDAFFSYDLSRAHYGGFYDDYYDVSGSGSVSSGALIRLSELP